MASADGARARLSWMWVFVMLNMIFADILTFMKADVLRQFLEGRAEQVVITPEFLLLAAVITEVPIAMVVLSQLLPKPACRWANMFAAVVTIAYIWGGGLLTAPHYIFFAAVQTVALSYIIRLAWKWRTDEERALRAAGDHETTTSRVAIP